MIEAIGNVGFAFAATGVMMFSVLYLTSVRWWTDVLGWAIAAVMALTSLVALMGMARISNFSLPGGVDAWRAILYPTLGLVIWVCSAIFIWIQFLTPRIKLIKEKRDERSRQSRESDLAADRPDRDGHHHHPSRRIY